MGTNKLNSEDKLVTGMFASPGGGSVAPERLGERYELLGLIGAGGMGNVYRARDLQLGDLVALKMIRDELSESPEGLERFRREVRLARRVTHRNVARVFDIGEHQGHPFLTMELIEGESLAAFMARERRLGTAEAVFVAVEVAAGLAAAHQAEVVHRDLKPENVLLAYDQRVVITDFGVARGPVLNEIMPGMTAGIAVGTPEYMAPEQVQNLPSIDHRADLYALGVMIYEMLTGEVPWTGPSSMAVLTVRLLEPPPDPRRLCPDMPTVLAELVLRLMATLPEHRPAETHEVLIALSEILRSLGGNPARLFLHLSNRPGRDTVPDGDLLGEPDTSEWPAVSVGHEARRKKVAVLPFFNAGVPEDEYLADGFTEELIDTLSMTRGLRVRSRGIVMHHKSSVSDPRELGRSLDVQVIVEGTLRRVGTALRVAVRISTVADGFQIWAQRYQRAADELFLLSDDVARDIATALTVSLEMPERPVSRDPRAVDLFLRARHAYHQVTSDSTEQSIDLCRQAMTLAPDDPEIVAGYALACARHAFYQDEGLELARDAAERACSLSLESGESRLARATVRVQQHELDAALEDLAAVIGRLAPELAEAHWLIGRLLSEAGSDDGIRALEHAMALDPRLVIVFHDLGRCYALRGERSLLEALAERDSQRALWVVRAREAFWRRDRARAAQLLASLPNDVVLYPTARSLLEVTLGLHGADLRKNLAQESLVANERSSWRKRVFCAQLEAELLAFERRADQSIAALRGAVQAGLFDLLWLDYCPLLDVLRPNPEFRKLRDRVVQRATGVRRSWAKLMPRAGAHDRK